MAFQKWEYAYIYFWWQNAPEATQLISLCRLHSNKPPSFEKLEQKQGLFKSSSMGQQWGQLRAWVTSLGEEGYEMAGVSSGVTHLATEYIYWFKRPATAQ